jgi:1,4-alpha-glucan branching enzyme
MSEDRTEPVPPASTSLLSAEDLYLFNEGTHRHLGDKLGAHLLAGPEGQGVRFSVWAPNASSVAVIGDFNGWDAQADALTLRGSSGIWEGEVPAARAGDVYKYAITTRDGTVLEKADPVAYFSEVPPRTGSVVADLSYRWDDDEWMRTRGAGATMAAPISIYEVHFGSWLRSAEDPNRLLTYAEVAPRLIEHVRTMGFTHVEFLPMMEHPFYGSWGYQVTGFFAPTARYGSPQDFMALIDALHRAGIGVLLDWVPSHFPNDAFGLAQFDGTHLYDHADPKLGVHPDWGSLIFNFGRHEVRSFLASSAEHWLSRYHVDGLRFDAVASMLYLDYSRKAGEWVPNVHGGRENLEAVSFLQQLNIGIYADHPDVQTMAEESTAWPGVSRPTDVGGLGFGFKWDMGWMHDTLAYMSEDPVHRRYHHHELTFRQVYAFTENFVLPLSHDEVVHGKGSLLTIMPGDDWQKFANLRLLFGYQFGQPGKKLLFMGSELGSEQEWAHEGGLDWGLLGRQRNAGLCRWVADLNRLYREQRPLHELDADPSGFEWVQMDGDDISVLSFLRRDADGGSVLVVCNFTPIPRHQLPLGVPEGGSWIELLNSDATDYGGSGVGNLGAAQAEPVPWRDRSHTVHVTVPPLACLFFRRDPAS